MALNNDIMLLLVGAFLSAFMGAVGWLVQRHTKAVDEMRKGIEAERKEEMKENIKVTAANTQAIIALQVEIRHLSERLAPIPKLQSDVNALWKQIRNGGPARKED